MNKPQHAPRVSVICPVFNTAPDMLRAAARSVLDEPSGQVIELIFCDDASTKAETRGMLEHLAAADPRVVVLQAARNGGPAKARNAGLAHAHGDWIGFIDSDDLWTPDHLACISDVLAVDPDASWISACHDILTQDHTRTPYGLISGSLAGKPVAPGVIRYAPGEATRSLVGAYWLHLGGCLVRSALARRVGGFEERAVYSEDWLFFLRLSLVADLFYLENSTYLLRRTHASFTRSSRRLTSERASGKRAALATPELAPYRRELRWALLSTYKELAANNLITGHRLRGAWFALCALAIDPRELASAARILRLAFMHDTQELISELSRYSTAELVKPDFLEGATSSDVR